VVPGALQAADKRRGSTLAAVREPRASDRIDIDQDMPVAERFGVKSIPTILVLRGGTEVARLDGLITDQDLTATFDHAAT
jgi:hypothetical protein